MLDVQLQDFLSKCDNLPKYAARLSAAIAPPHNIIHVAHHTAHIRIVGKESIKAREIGISKMLGGEGTNGQTATRRCVMPIDDPRTQVAHARMLQVARQQAIKHLVVDAGKVATDVNLRVVGISARVVLRALYRSERALALSASEGIVDQPTLEHRTHLGHQRMVQYALFEGRGVNEAPLRIPYPERAHAADFHRTIENGVSEGNEVALQRSCEGRRCNGVSARFRRERMSPQQIGKRRHFL
ncbi:MAG: hypothetical protein AAGA68_24410 [Pseudomonadota bacterium]